MRSESWTHLRTTGLALGLLLSCGCTRTVLDASVADTLGGSDVTSELDFWDALAEQSAVTNRDALHALLLTFEALPTTNANHEEKGEGDAGETQPGAFDAELATARQRGWIGESDALVANQTAPVGWIARAICIEAGIEGGLNMHLFGPTPRYALRELKYERLMNTKSENQALSGLELIATIGRVQDRRTGLVSAPRQDF